MEDDPWRTEPIPPATPHQGANMAQSRDSRAANGDADSFAERYPAIEDLQLDDQHTNEDWHDAADANHDDRPVSIHQSYAIHAMENSNGLFMAPASTVPPVENTNRASSARPSVVEDDPRDRKGPPPLPSRPSVTGASPTIPPRPGGQQTRIIQEDVRAPPPPYQPSLRVGTGQVGASATYGQVVVGGSAMSGVRLIPVEGPVIIVPIDGKVIIVLGIRMLTRLQ
ncbi:hypothetical protein HK101_004582 [Irineochytrium annulatum]|nr:hypothetical protein HK101_004582 [Irineochytrium annulatum]